MYVKFFIRYLIEFPLFTLRLLRSRVKNSETFDRFFVLRKSLFRRSALLITAFFPYD